MTPTPSSDLGFSLLEVLVALAIASLVAMAIGGLFLLTSELRTRTKETEQTEAALVSLQGMQSLLSRDLDLHIEAPSSSGFELVAGTSNGAGAAKAIAIRLVPEDRPPRIEVTSAGGPVSVDLSPFQTSNLEYLILDAAGKVAWTPEDRSLDKPLAVRLRLVFGARVWRPLLWIVAHSSSGTMNTGVS